MKIALALIALCAGLLLAGDDAQAGTSEKIRDLHKEHIAALQQVADLLAAEYKNDRRTYDELFQSRVSLLNAKLDASETTQERVKLHESIVELTKERETFFTQAMKLDKVDKLKVLSAKADRIKAEIGLEEAKDSGAKQPK